MYAIKIIDKKALKGKEDSLENEIRVLKRYSAVTRRKGGIVIDISYFQVGPSQRSKIIRSLRKPNLCLLSDGTVSCFTYFYIRTFSG